MQRRSRHFTGARGTTLRTLLNIGLNAGSEKGGASKPECRAVVSSRGAEREDVIHHPKPMQLVNRDVADESRRQEHLVCRLQDALQV